MSLYCRRYITTQIVEITGNKIGDVGVFDISAALKSGKCHITDLDLGCEFNCVTQAAIELSQTKMQGMVFKIKERLRLQPL